MNDRREKLTWFKEIILPHRPALLRRLRRILPAGYDVDDVVAETLARTFAMEDWREIRHGLAFITRIARNILIDQQRREAIVSFDLMADIDALQRSVNYDGMLSARDELRRLEQIIETLPPQPRRAFILRRVHGHSVADIAEKMQLSVSTIEKHLTKALALVTRAMAEHEGYAFEEAAQREQAARGHRGSGRPLGGASEFRPRR